MGLLSSFGDWLKNRPRTSVDRNKVDLNMIGIAKSEQYVDDNGVVQTRLVFTTDYRPSTELRVSDFSLHNLLAAGVQLRDVGALNGGVLSGADNAIDVVESSKPVNNE